MDYETPAQGRASIRDTGRGLEVSVPPSRRPQQFLIMAAYAVGGVLIVVQTLPLVAEGRFFRGDAFSWAFFTVWYALVGLLIGVALYGFAWLLAGRETLTVDGVALHVRRAIGGVGRTRRYAWSHVKGLRASTEVVQQSNLVGWFRNAIYGAGSIAFDYGMSTRHCAAGLEEAEAAHVVARIRERFGGGGAP